MYRRRLDPKLVALLAYALVVNAVLWASGAAQAFDARHAFCGPAGVAASTALPDAGIDHTCCDLACAKPGHVPVPVALALLAASPTSHGGRVDTVWLAPPLAPSERPPVRGPPGVL
jgi:hypothetical protein